MNEFIKLRNSVYNDINNISTFPLVFFDKCININKNMELEESTLIRKIQIIDKIKFRKNLEEQDIYDLCSFLGENQYLDRFVVDAILKLFNNSTKIVLGDNIKNIITKKKYNSQKLYHIIDLCIECNMDILDHKDLSYMILKYRLDLDVLSILIDYLYSFKKSGFKEIIYDLLKCEYPDTIKMQLLNLIVYSCSVEKFDDSFVNFNIRDEKNKVFYDSYIDFLNENSSFKNQGFSIMQSMFYGDLEDSGKGNNGGLAVLLKGLGDEISKDDRLSFVFTITITGKLNKPFISYYGEKHVFIRLPIYLDETISDPFIKRELFIKRYIGDFLKKKEIKPDIFHIRYLDNASKAVANLSKELNKQLVFTLTPDPHRNMFDESGKLKQYSFTELIEKLNKIKIGDELLYKSDGLVGIGDKDVRDELEIYFPQLKEENMSEKIRMIGEGIQINKEVYEGDSNEYLNEFIKSNEIDKDFFEKPIILNVGRIAIQKGQIELLKAWSNSKLSQTYNLLIIGGDLENPSKEEEMIINFFKEHMEKSPHLKSKLFHKGAMPNENIKLLEKSILNNSFDYPHIYLSSSIKEEFGISILEAMSLGYLAIGPIKGGVKSYIKNGENGFLIDTSSWETIAKESVRYIFDFKIDKDGFKKIQDAGRKTVYEHFSMNKIAGDLLSFYFSLKGKKNNEL